MQINLDIIFCFSTWVVCEIAKPVIVVRFTVIEVSPERLFFFLTVSGCSYPCGLLLFETCLLSFD